MLFGEDAVVANKPRPICALNDSLITVELLVIEDGNHVAHNRGYRYRAQSADWMAEQLGI
jgi:hypothetical protein